MAGLKAIEQIEFVTAGGRDVPVAYFDESFSQDREWLLVVGLMNVTFLKTERAEVIRRLKNVIEMLEEE